MRSVLILGVAATFAIYAATYAETATASDGLALLKTHCSGCHSGDDPEGDFSLAQLGNAVHPENESWWESSYENVHAGEMPPADDSIATRAITSSERVQIAEYLRAQLRAYVAPGKGANDGKQVNALVPRRLNNREFANSIASALMIEDVGTHRPLGGLLGDTLLDGFDTNGDALGISEYHLEQYIDACRKIIDAVVLAGDQPESQRYRVPTQKLRMSSLSQNTKRNAPGLRSDAGFDFTDPRLHMYFDNFQSAPASGRYRISIRATGVDRGYYDSQQTGIYDGDAIALQVRLGDRHFQYELPDDDVMEIQLNEWLAAGTRIELHYPTDGLRLRGNGNFKFQFSIAHDHLQANDPATYERVFSAFASDKSRRNDKPLNHWKYWTDRWRGPRPRIISAEIEGPFYESWPSQRQIALVGASPSAASADSVKTILRPIAQRTWRRDVRDGELDSIATLVQKRQEDLGDLAAIKEGIVAIFLSPSFLLINTDEATASDRFATKLSYFLRSSPPSERFRAAVANGAMGDFATITEYSRAMLASGKANAFLEAFPRAWLQLDRINFMAPDPDQYPLYHRKGISEDMIAEALAFFRHAVDQNVPLPEMLTADYSFVNADLAQVYDLDDVPSDSQLRKYTFTDQRRGGLLGMGAFLTLTADSLGTSPIHRGVYVLENFLGTKPSPPPGDLEIAEPDVRNARTIKEVLQAHVSNESCASCHRSIDPYGYAFENFDPAGRWRDAYVKTIAKAPKAEAKVKPRKRETPKVIRTPIDSSARFRSGDSYADIIDFRRLMKTDANQERFVRCFIKKLLFYANGEEPDNFGEVDKILAVSAKHDYRIVETIAAVIDSPLFCDR